MRRLTAITAFAVFLAVPLWAQHGGGGHSGGGFGGGHAGGFSGGHSASFAGHSGFSGSHFSSASPSVHAYSGPRSQAMPRSYASRGFAPVPSARFSTRSSSHPFLHDNFRNSHVTVGIGGLGFRSFGFRNFRNCIGLPCRSFGWPWWYAGYFDPWWWWDQDYNYDQDYQQNLAQAQQMNEDSLEEQQMRRQQEDADGDQDAYARRAPRPSAGDEKPGAPIIPATVLVFRDQHKQEVENYAIVGNALWTFAPQHTQRIPLTELDLTATAEANDDRGVSFRIPHPGQ